MRTFFTLTVLLFTSLSAYTQIDSLPRLEAYFSAVIVEDIDRSLDWYTSKLGFEVLNHTALPDRGFEQANLSNGSVLLELIKLDGSVSDKELLTSYPPKTKLQGFFKFGFAVAEFDRWINHLKDSEVTFQGNVVTDALSGKRMVIINDPDDNRIQLFEE